MPLRDVRERVVRLFTTNPRGLAASVGVAAVVVGVAVGGAFFFSKEPVGVQAVVGSPAGMCADSAVNLATLYDIRVRIEKATSTEEIRRLVDEFYSLRTHSRIDIERARDMKEKARRAERLRGRIAALRDNPAAAPYADKLNELEARINEAKKNKDLNPIEEEIAAIEIVVGVSTSVNTGAGTPPAGDTSTETGNDAGGGGGGLDVPEGDIPASLGSDVPPIGNCRPAKVQASYPSGPRGRVQVGHGTVLTDRGTLLRAVHGARKRPTEWWRRMRDEFGFNAVRFDVRFTTYKTNQGGPDSMNNLLSDSELGNIVRELDYAVAKAKEMGMYVIITNFTTCCGQYNEEVDQFVWRTIAPRYKDEPHVIYELHNEPVGNPRWACSSSLAWQQDMIREYPAYMVRLYHLVRSLAPDTHIILWTPMYGLSDLGRYLYAWVTGTKPAQGELPLECYNKMFGNMTAGQDTIDYSNASVGVHAYPGYAWGQSETQAWYWVEKLRAEGYPVIVTEFSQFCDGEPEYKQDANVRRVFEYLENKQISWAYLECFKPEQEDGTRGGGGNYGVGIMLTCTIPWLWQAPSP